MTTCSLETKGRGLIVNLVEGRTIKLKSNNGRIAELNLYETMVIPEASILITITNQTIHKCKLVYSFVRSSAIDNGLNDPKV